MKTYLQNRSKNRSFSKDRSFTVPGLLMQKSVFLTHHVVHSIRVNWKSERSLNFSSSRMPWLYRPKNLYGGLVDSDKSGPKSVGHRTYFRQRFFFKRARICRIGARSADICSIVLNGVPHPFSSFSLKISKRFTQNLLKDQQSRLVYKNYLENNFSSVWFPLKQHILLVVRQLGQLGVPVNWCDR